jgi:glycosyltransferase involved in cell wall biosynthesis
MSANPSNGLLISVVIPTRNRSRLLQETIESLWNQTLEPASWEIIVADNCSTDDTAQCVERLRRRSPCGMHYCRLDRDRGPAGARNAGAALARGRFILFLDSDVFLAPDWLSKALTRVSWQESWYTPRVPIASTPTAAR